MHYFSRPVRFLAAAAMLLALPAIAQVPTVAKFTGSKPDAGWVFGGSPALTAPGFDAEGSGWLRLSGLQDRSGSIALNTGAAFNPAAGVSVSLTYAVWGGGPEGGDGLSLFLFDASTTMAGSSAGGGLGFCKGLGGWLGIGLDESGNFSNPQDACGPSGPGVKPQTLTLRGPAGSANPFIAQNSVPGNIDRPQSNARDGVGQVTLTLLPKSPGTGFSVSVDWRRGTSGPWTRLMNHVDFPFAAPSSLRIGVGATTGTKRNMHEVRDIAVQVHVPPLLSQVFEPATVSRGGTSTWVLRLATTNNLPTALAGPFVHRLPKGLVVASPPRLGGTCPGDVQARSGSDAITMAAGSTVRAAGCTVTVDVTSAAAGAFESTVPAFALATDTGFNLASSTATLNVRP